MTAQKSPLLMLTVVSGPDAGRSLSFRKARVAIGRDAANDFMLTDGFVSNRHAEFVVEGDQVVFQDLKSRHGSLVIRNGVSTKLQNRESVSRLPVKDGAEFQIGSSILKLELPEGIKAPSAIQAQTLREPSFVVKDGPPNSNEQFITAAHEPIHALTRRFDSHDKRLELLFKLSEQLNSLTRLEDILDMIVDATFDAFPGANFFGMTLLQTDGGEIPPPFLTRVRANLNTDSEPVLSSSIVRRVVESKESVLWVRDNLGSQVSQSILDAKITACLCAPLVGQRKLLGVMQVDTRGRGTLFSKQDLDLFTILASNAAFAVERAELTNHIVKMFESFVDASVTAIEARDQTTAGHSHRVSEYTMELARTVHSKKDGPFADIEFSPEQFTELRYGTLLHDFGKIAVPEDVLQKPTRLRDVEMEAIRHRLSTVRAQSERALWQALAEGMADGRMQPEPSSLDDVRGRSEEVATELKDIWTFLQDLNTKGFVPDEDLERLGSIGARSYVNEDGETRPLLTAHEIENLSIRKGTLNETEWVQIKNHAVQSQRILERIPWSDDLAMVPYLGGAHHEKLDGSGYPLGLKGESLNIQCRMLTIADIFDALTAADRPYRKAASVDRAIHILRLEAKDGKLDSDLVELFASEVVPKITNMIPLQYEGDPTLR